MVADAEHLALPPRRGAWDASRLGVIWCPGHAEDHRQGLWPGFIYHVNAAIAAAGYPVLCIDAGGPSTWANDASRSAIDAACDQLSRSLGARSDKVMLAGLSLGALDLLGWARAHTDRVAGIALFIPAVSIGRHYRANRPNYARAEIEAAYGTASGYPAGAAERDPTEAPAAYAGMPIKAWYASDDASAPPEWAEQFLKGVGPSAEGRSLGPVGHDPASIPGAEVAAFVRECAERLGPPGS